MVEKLAASIVCPPSATRHSTELAANATSAKLVAVAVCTGPHQRVIPTRPGSA